MFAEQLTSAIVGASLNTLDNLARTVWQGYAAGAIADDQAQLLAQLIEARRAPARAARQTVGIPAGRASIFPPRRVQRSPDRARSLERRRTLAASGPIPPTLAARFTTGELAVLRIVADAVRDNGQCVLPVDAIAARAGVCRRLAQNAIREAARQGLLTIQERRREGRRNDPNVLRIISDEWLAWVERGSGCKKLHATDKRTSFRWKKNGLPQRSSTSLPEKAKKTAAEAATPAIVNDNNRPHVNAGLMRLEGDTRSNSRSSSSPSLERALSGLAAHFAVT